MVLRMVLVGMFLGIAQLAIAADRQADVAAKGADVMPFSLAATTHIFTKTPVGGVQQVVAKQPDDTIQIAQIRAHLADIKGQFLAGNFGGPEHIHGEDMPGLAQLRQAKLGDLVVNYLDLPNGAQLEYSSDKGVLVDAIHAWFDAQLADHGKDAVDGAAHHHHHPM